MKVMLNHAVGVFIIALVSILGLNVGAEVHASAVPPAKERLSVFVHAGNEILRGSDCLIIDGFHTLLGKRTGVFNRLPALAVGFAMQHSAWSESLAEGFATR